MADTFPEPIAIIGSGCRFPGNVNSPLELWDLLQKPKDLLKKVDRFNINNFYHESGKYHGATNVQQSYLLDQDFRLFDPGFFGIRPVEAESMDPLQRLLLETVYEALEDAGLPMENLQGSDTAFYAGIMATDYEDILLRDFDHIPQYYATATARSILSNRISYVFDWHGPSMTIDTACSSSLIAVHSACQSLRTGESRVAVAAGGNLILGPELYIALSKLNMLSTSGRSAMWDADVDGYGRGEGFAVVVMKRLSDAIQDGDSIDCIIRGTATNQDGRTQGITLPSPIAQTQLIRQTYAKAGLDLSKPEDQPQFFEAHGTGTKAGDPREAEAIYNAFFDADFDTSKQKHGLFVGSIKTVVGHTEGTAGLAGLLKASLSLQAGKIPPNMLFNNLNPEIAPFVGPLKLPTKAVSWPSLPQGVPRRASVNSFGFGGSNAHAILERYIPPENGLDDRGSGEGPHIIPFVFSASSEAALQKSLLSYHEYLITHPGIDLHDLAWTLSVRRSALPVKVAIPASSGKDLGEKINQKLRNRDEAPGSSIGVRSVSGDRKILGVFTGQGAQWARMGKELIETIPRARQLVDHLNNALRDLPELYRPSWNLMDELLRESTTSHLQEAAFSQPICTVIQVILVDILRAAGIEFSAVIGHSSGEIGAAYAAGFLSASDAIKIAYLRGFCASAAAGPSGEKGAMMAAGVSLQEAERLCSQRIFKGRIKLAANNSSSSVTLSGDSDAIAGAKAVLDNDHKFARLLKVDTAYHSHHMKPCARLYIQALNATGVTPNAPSGTCLWYSSVLDGNKVNFSNALRDMYWTDNMVKAVLFSQATTSAIENSGPFQMAIEVGPHPALKGPVTQTLAELGVDIQYIATLNRNESDVSSISDCLGTVWARYGGSAVDFDAVSSLLPKPTTPRLLKGIPVYAWDHDKPYWYESRTSRLFRSRLHPPHELLGTRCDEGNESEFRWRNFLSVQDLSWLDGHQIQGQIVFPAAGYVCMALEAAQMVAEDATVQLLEVEDFVIGRPIVFDDDKTSIEIMFTISNVTREAATNEMKGSIKACFSISSHVSSDHSTLTKVANGRINVIVGESSSIPPLPPRGQIPAHLIDVDIDRFYSNLETVGYGYKGQFRAFSEMRRRLNYSTGTLEQPLPTNDGRPLLVQPSLLDHAFQALFGAYSWPGDGRLWTLFLPASIGKITVDLMGFKGKNRSSSQVDLAFDAWLTDSPSREIQGDVVFSTNDQLNSCSIIQVERARMVSLAENVAHDDRHMFFETVWGISGPNGELAVGPERATEYEWELAEACERIAHYYWRRLDKILTPYERESCKEQNKHLLKAIGHLLNREMDGKQSYIQENWLLDKDQFITDLIQKYSFSTDIRLLASVGRALPAAIRGETTMLEHMRADGMLDDFYTQSLGLPASNRYLARMVKQLVHRYPRLNFLEIGAGTGASTQAIFDTIGSAYSSYTYTDISSGFFEKAAVRFATERDKVVFKTFDVERAPESQGYKLGSFDVIIASNVLHATSSLNNTLRNTRRLLKPGGFLFLLEITDNTTIRYTFSMGGLPGWWLGVAEGRLYSPCISRTEWGLELRKAGFSGTDTMTPARDLLPNPFSVIGAQAVNDKVEILRQPLLKTHPTGEWHTLYVLGGQKLTTSNLVESVSGVLEAYFGEILTVVKLEDIGNTKFPPKSTFISFLDLDGPVWKDLAPNQLRALQILFEKARNLLWITHSQMKDNPYSNATVGFLRSMVAESPTLRTQVLDFDDGENPEHHARTIAEVLIRLQVTDSWELDPVYKDQLLWTTEPELRFQDCKMWVPRVKAHAKNNDRLNVQRRAIVRKADENTLIQLSEIDEFTIVREHYGPKAMPSDDVEDTVTIRVRYSTLWAPKSDIEGSFLLLVIGQQVGTDQWLVSLATERRSLLKVSRSWTVHLHDLREHPLNLIAALLVENVAKVVAEFVHGDNRLVLVHEPDPLMASALLKKADAHDFRVKFLTENATRCSSEWIYLHPRQTVRAAQQALPADTGIVVFLPGSRDSGFKDFIVSCLPLHCTVLDEFQALRRQPTHSLASVTRSDEYNFSSLVVGARTSLSEMQMGLIQSFTGAHVVSLLDLPKDIRHIDALGLIDWQVESPLLLEVAPPRPALLFKQDRTYMLVGMTGEMGRSLCEWMVRNGAGAVVLTSRNPKIDQAWVDELQELGAKIKIAAFDATNRHAWIEFKSEIEKELPPLAGILNGAVVLQDQFFLDMDIDRFNKTLAVKIDGTVYLDEVFCGHPLDFFIVFSSLSSIIGNRGQTNYNAANAFMTSLVKQRRARGQAGTVIHLGSVVGVGYLTRAGDVMENILVKYGYTPVSEVDLHHIFAQAIMAGLPDSGENSDIITGLRYARDDEDSGLHWASNPRFSHMILPPEKSVSETGAKRAVQSVRAQLMTATTTQEALRILQSCFGAKIISILQMTESSFRPDAALIELGVDSLVAVEVRSWFLKEISVDIAVLKILGGASTIGLCQSAMEQVSKELLPRIASEPRNDSNSEKSTSGVSAVQPQANVAPVVAENKSSFIDPEKALAERSAVPTSPGRLAPSALSSSSGTPSTATLSALDETSVSSVASENERADPELQHCARISAAQSRFWFLNMFLTDRTASNITLSFRVQGAIQAAELGRAIRSVGETHESLKTCFMADRNSLETAWQGVMIEPKIKFVHHKVSTDAEIEEAYMQVRNTVYELQQGECMQVVLLSSNPMAHTIIFGYHHIILDGVGFQVFLTHLEQAYAGKSPSPQGLQYTSYSENEALSVGKSTLKDKLSYWRDEFRDTPTVLPLLPVSKVRSRRAMSTYGSNYVEKRLDSRLASQIKLTCRQWHTTPSHFYLATFRVMLMRLAGIEDLCIGLADANRHEDNVISTVGLFLNMLPLRFKGYRNSQFSEILRETRTKVYGALGHAGIPFDELLKALHFPRSSSHSPLFQAFFDYHTGTQEELKFGNTTWKSADRHPGERAYDLTLDIIEGSAGSLISLIGQAYLYGLDETGKMLDCYLSLLEEFANDPSTMAEAPKLYGQGLVDTALQASQGPSMKFEWSSTLGHRVYEMCQQNPEGVAIRDGHGLADLTYSNLQNKAFTICNQLLSAGVKPGDSVAVFQKPGPEWICSMIAAFWAGAVYVPLVLSNPIPRLAAIVEAAKPAIILVHGPTAEMGRELGVEISKLIDVDALASTIESRLVAIPVAGEDPAVILFTSGSTGIPKGIILRHRNIKDHIEGYVKHWSIGQEVVLQQSAFSFDLSIGQIFTALAMGGTLVVVSDQVRGDPVALARLIQQERVTWTLLTPSEYSSLLQFGADNLRRAVTWRHALACGEALTGHLVQQFRELDHKAVRLYNAYGPAEAVISATMAEIWFRGSNDNASFPIGRPNPNYAIYIVDEQLNPLPQGFPGEIMIGGCGIGIGYLNEEKLTAEKFLPNKLVSFEHREKGWNVTYRTGDIGRMKKDGTILYEGRREGDTQVKVRGFRVDLHDVESTLLNASNGVISDAVVSMQSNAQALVARVQFTQCRQPQDSAAYLNELLEALQLPAYMKPTILNAVASFPRNIHGKKDRSAIAKLPLCQNGLPPADSAAELGVTEQRLAETWREILPEDFAGLFYIGADTDFFAVGGNSLLLVKLQARIREVFDISVPLIELLDLGSLAKMAKRIEASRAVKKIDWENETTLDEELIAEAATNVTPRTMSYGTGQTRGTVVLLTGATGYFGRYLLDELVRNPKVRTIHCVAVRGGNHVISGERLPYPSSSKVVVHTGNLASPRLGLSQEVAERITAEADFIIHSGARRSFWDNYYELREVNVRSTMELVRIDTPRRIAIHFLSSSGVLYLDDSIDYSKESSVAAFRPPADGSEGYVASKWASEVLLEKAGCQLGIPVTTHRFTPKATPSAETVNQGALEELVKAAARLGKLPERSTWSGRVDSIQSDLLAGRISSSLLVQSDSNVNFIHHQADASVQLEELVNFLDRRLGNQISEKLGLLEWVGAVKEVGYRWLFSTHHLTLTTNEHGMVTKVVNRR